ncbi:sensor histidine kinase [Algimonas arctica]|nr:ATP-binding protein [Algimonas arctica]
MIKMIKTIGARLERFLRIDSSSGSAARIRARIVYGTGLICLCLQLLNMVSMSVVYKSWTSQHYVATISCLIFLGMTLALRYTKSPTFFGGGYAALAIISIGVAASVETIPGHPPYGINTALVPLLCSGAAFIAFIGTRAVSAAYLIASLILIGALYKITADSNPTGVDAILAWQRTVQASIAALMVGGICTAIATIVFRNLTELEAALVRAKSAEQARTNFLSTMSHEIRTPLHGILGLSDLLARSELPNPQDRYAQLITVSANNLMEIIDEVLEMARLEDGTVQTKAEPFNPALLLQDVCDLFAVKATEKELWMGTDIDPNIPPVLIGDNSHLRQVISNLVGNALKFTQSGGVRIGARLAGINAEAAAVQFYVQDSGVGIALEDQSVVFERFKQTDSAKISTIKGTGLGLSICRELTDIMGSTLELMSNPGEGTTFYFTLTLPIALETSEYTQVA